MSEEDRSQNGFVSVRRNFVVRAQQLLPMSKICCKMDYVEALEYEMRHLHDELAEIYDQLAYLEASFGELDFGCTITEGELVWRNQLWAKHRELEEEQSTTLRRIEILTAEIAEERFKRDVWAPLMREIVETGGRVPSRQELAVTVWYAQREAKLSRQREQKRAGERQVQRLRSPGTLTVAGIRHAAQMERQRVAEGRW